MSKWIIKFVKMSKKGTQKTKITILVLNQSRISAILIVRFPGDQKTTLTGQSLYKKS